MAVNPQNKKDVKDTLKVFEDGLNSVVASFSTRLKESLKEIDDNIASGIAKNLGREVTNDLNSAIRLSNKQVENQEKLINGQLKSKDVEKQLLDLRIKRAQANQNSEALLTELRDAQFQAQKIKDQERSDVLARQIAKINEEKEIADSILDTRQKSGNQQLKDAKAVEESTGGLGELFNRLAKNKFFGSLLDADGALVEMKKKAADLQGKGKLGGVASKAKIAYSGIGGMLSGLVKVLKPVAIIGAAFKGLGVIIEFIIGLLFRGDKLTTSIAQNLGVSKRQAQGMMLALRDANIEFGESNFNLEQMIGAQNQFVKTQGVLTASSFEQAKAMATLTERLGISGDNAALLLTYMQANGEEFDKVFNSVQQTASAINRVNENGINAQMIFQELGNTSADILANFGFSFKEITKAVSATRRLGVSLTQAKNIADGLLDFESSITAEMEAEILLGRQFNFERARAAAATGDIATATQEVLKQTQNLTDEQLKSPIIQQAIAKATGLSTEEFTKARAIQKALINDRGKLTKLLNSAKSAEERALIEQGILRGAGIDQIKENISVQDKFNNAIQNVKDQFQTLATSGALEKVFNYFSDVAIALGEGKTFFNLFGEDAFDIAGNKAVVRANEDVLMSHLKNRQAKNGKVVDDTLTTKSDNTADKKRDETNALLNGVLTEMKKSTVLNINSNQVVQKAILTTYK